jgi:hypothetical protein
LWTGEEPIGCPWHALKEPLVVRARQLDRWRSDEVLELMAGPISHYEIEALDYYRYISDKMAAKELEQKQQESKHGQSHRKQ